MRVNMSATGSDHIVSFVSSLPGVRTEAPRFYAYQLAFRTPGIIPSWAMLRKQILHT
jgi:hypothetical protein